MGLFIVQHGKSLPKTQDPAKGLSPEGIREVWRIAEVASTYGVQTSRILHSGKKRAQETAAILSKALNPDQGMELRNDLNPMDDPASFANTIEFQDNLMVVGHLPFLERLISHLIINSCDPVIFKLQNGGIVYLDYFSHLKSIAVKWALMPNIP